MKFSEKWLREWVDPPVSTQELAHQLTMAGLEVDAIEPVAAEFDHVVVALVQDIEPHPDADKLRVCRVDAGLAEPLTIVCGAANVAAGLKVPCAKVGARLPGGLNIKQAKLRGVESHGMLCSEAELGLAETASGLLILPDDAPVGTGIRDYLQLDDVSIELGLTPNRGDCLGIAGVAREVAVINRTPVIPPSMELVAATHEATLGVELEAPTACPHYVGRIIRGVNVAATTPMWMQERLRRSGLRSLSPVVDVTNYVLLELGQPMHAFDLAKLNGDIRVRFARDGERLTLIDGQEIQLTEDSLVIADAQTPVALAGIMGGSESAVGDATRDIFLESAYFEPIAIAGRARSFGMHTDSSHRFERGVSPDLQAAAIERATALLLDIVGGEPGPVVEHTVAEHMPVRTPVRLRYAQVARILGGEISSAEVEDILQRLGMQLEPQAQTDDISGEQGWMVTPPAARFDISLEPDLVEEVGRIYGYDNVPSSRPSATLTMAPRSDQRVDRRRLEQTLVQRGYQEAISYSFVDPQLQALLEPDTAPIALANPLASDMAVMRTSLWPGLIKLAQYNLNRQQGRLKLFELGLNFRRQDAEITQETVVSGLLSGNRLPEQWGVETQDVDFFDTKGDVEALLGLAGGQQDAEFKAESHPALHPGQSARVYRGQRPIGWLGRLHPRVQQQLDLPKAVYLFELSVGALSEALVPKFEELSRFPSIRRDLAVIVNADVIADEVLKCASKAAPELLNKVELFDVYAGEGIDSGRKSLALGLTLQDLSRTLTDTDVEDVMRQILAALNNKFGATLRE
jgi:phenylalanyl-tRNA synthetase beta chain